MKLRLGLFRGEDPMDTGDGWCIECGEYFHLDNCGGYNPPCRCVECQGFYCRSCHRENEGDDYERPEESYPDEPGVAPTKGTE
jgi:hypothetical protein